MQGLPHFSPPLCVSPSSPLKSNLALVAITHTQNIQDVFLKVVFSLAYLELYQKCVKFGFQVTLFLRQEVCKIQK